MSMDATAGDHDLMVQVAWLYYVGGNSQEDIARKLGVSRFKITRILAQAREAQIVKISIEHATADTLALADRFERAFGLGEVIVTPSVDPGSRAEEGDTPDSVARRGVAIAASRLVSRRLQTEGPVTVGVGWGRSLAAFADAFSGVRKKDVRFVSLMGSLTRNAATNSFDVVVTLARATGGEAYFLPAPFIANSVSDVPVFLAQRSVQETLALARTADFLLISLGECNADSLLYRSGLISDADLADLAAAGAVGDTTGKFFDAEGRLVDSEINERTPSIGLADMHAREVVLLAAGLGKVAALGAILKAGFVNRLVVDERLARALLETV